MAYHDFDHLVLVSLEVAEAKTQGCKLGLKGSKSEFVTAHGT